MDGRLRMSELNLKVEKYLKRVANCINGESILDMLLTSLKEYHAINVSLKVKGIIPI